MRLQSLYGSSALRPASSFIIPIFVDCSQAGHIQRFSTVAFPTVGLSVAPLRRKCLSFATTNALASAARSSTTQIEDGLWAFSLDGTKITSLVHSTWKQVVKAGDTVIDATCGNGLDTLMLAKLVCTELHQGLVYGFDLQQSALDNTSWLLDRELNAVQREHVKLLSMCHTKLGEVTKSDDHVSLVAFNLGYLPGGNKHMITQTETTIKALESAVKVVRPGGMISIMAYIGHPGGREEYEAVRDFAISLPMTSWVCSHHEWLNRPLCPHLFFLFRK